MSLKSDRLELGFSINMLQSFEGRNRDEISMNSDMFARVLFSRNVATATFCENQTRSLNGKNHSVVY